MVALRYPVKICTGKFRKMTSKEERLFKKLGFWHNGFIFSEVESLRVNRRRARFQGWRRLKKCL